MQTPHRNEIFIVTKYDMTNYMQLLSFVLISR